MNKIPPILSTPLSANSKAFIVYFCGLRSHKYKFLRVKSVCANFDIIQLETSSCLLRLGPSGKTSWRIEGDMVTKQCISLEAKDTITGLLCRCLSEVPIVRWTVDVSLTNDSSTEATSVPVSVECPTKIGTEMGSQTVVIPCDGGELDIYYLMIRPTFALEPDGGESSGVSVPGENSAQAFVLRPVGAKEDPKGKSLLCVGHRGMGVEYADMPVEERWPENTILSFCKAAQLGIPMVELDVLPVRDSDDLIIYHNFNVVTRLSGRKRPCGCPEYEVNIFDEPVTCNKTMPNLISSFSLNELQDLKWGSHSKTCKKATHEYEEAEPRVSDEQPVLLRRGTHEAEYLPLFSDALALTPTRLALDVELKYPQDTPCMYFKLLHELGVSKKCLMEFGHPYRYFYSINRFADTVIRTLHTQGKGRAIVLSTFNVDLCLALRLKQSTFPVLLISRAGYEQPFSVNGSSISTPAQLPPPPHTLDPRHRNAMAVVEWAHLIGMAGVVIRGEPLESPEGAVLAQRMANYRLACIPFGPSVSLPSFKRRAIELGITGICIDDVQRNAW